MTRLVVVAKRNAVQKENGTHPIVLAGTPDFYATWNITFTLRFVHFQIDCWFDPKMLANYLVSTKTFQHPLNRRDLSREECLDLEAHMGKSPFLIISFFLHERKISFDSLLMCNR
jgi:hypothetical protein